MDSMKKQLVLILVLAVFANMSLLAQTINLGGIMVDM